MRCRSGHTGQESESSCPPLAPRLAGHAAPSGGDGFQTFVRHCGRADRAPAVSAPLDEPQRFLDLLQCLAAADDEEPGQVRLEVRRFLKLSRPALLDGVLLHHQATEMGEVVVAKVQVLMEQNDLSGCGEPRFGLREDSWVSDPEQVPQRSSARVDVGVVGHPDDERSGALGRPADLLHQLAY